MKGRIFRLAERCASSILAFKENKGGVSFYAPNLEVIPFSEELKAETSGIFTNFYPEDKWLSDVAEGYIVNSAPEFTPCRDKEETLNRVFSVCSLHSGEKVSIPKFENHEGSDGLNYMEEGPAIKGKREMRFDDSDVAFFLYRVKKKADTVEGDGFFIGESGKKLLLSMAFLEADMLRCIKRGDTAVISKRAKDVADKYLDYYFDKNIEFSQKGKISLAVSEFLKTVFYISGSKALCDEEFVKR